MNEIKSILENWGVDVSTLRIGMMGENIVLWTTEDPNLVWHFGPDAPCTN